MTGYGPPGSPPPPPGGYGPPQGGGYGPPPGDYGSPAGGGFGAPQGGGYGPPPGNYGPPGGGGYGAPGGYGTPPRGGVSLAAVNPFDWAAMAAGIVALIFSFFSFYSFKPAGSDANAQCKHISDAPASLQGQLRDVCDGISNGAWHGFFGWFGVLLAVIGAIVIALAVFAPRISLPVAPRVIALSTFALGFISVLIALFVIPDGEYMGQTIDSGGSDVDAGHSFSYWIVLVVILAGAVVTFLSFQQGGGSLTNLFGTGGSRGSSQPPPGYGQPPQGPPPGYGQQPPQGPPPGYGQPPQGPPPGYGQQ